MSEQLLYDSELLESIKGAPDERMRALKHLFQSQELKSFVIKYVCAHGGFIQDAEDVFQETVIIFDRAIRENKFNGQSSLKTYFWGIAKWRWLGIQRKNGRNIEK